jgi:FAD:protein FMN transferase
MGTHIEVLGGGDGPAFERAVAAVRTIFDQDEQRFSRFRPDSELSVVNASAGIWTVVSVPFARLLRLALDGARRSGGLFDPTVLHAMEAAGYDRDFGEIRTRAGADGPRPPRTRPDWRAVRCRGRRVRLPEGVGLDFGGIAKGWSVDRAAASAGRLLPWVLVNAGGDLRLVGQPPGGSLEIGIEEPLEPGVDASRICLESGAVATSSQSARCWGPGLHHLIDPRTSRPTRTEIIQATVWAESCAEAEVRSKWALLAGAPALDRFSGILFLAGDRILTNMLGEVAA